jgi:hypothetical protein
MYIDRAFLDPSLPVALREVCRRTNIASSTLDTYKAHELVAPELARLKALRESREAVAAAALSAADDGTGDGERRENGAAPVQQSEQAMLDEVQLAQGMNQALSKAVWTMQRFVGRNRRVGHVSDLPRAARDLDVAVRELHGALGSLRGLADEWIRLQGAGTPPTRQYRLTLEGEPDV